MAEQQTITRPGRLEPHHALLAITVIWVALALIWMPATPFTVDGYVATAMAQAMAEHGSLLIDNGYAGNPTPALDLPLITPHDGHLAPQYPGGWGLIAAPAWALGGMRGVMVFNALLGAATIWVVYATAERLSDRKDIALWSALLFGGASFAVDYSLGLWTHASSAFLSALGVYAVGRSDRMVAAPWLIAAGLVFGLGANIRVDVIFPAMAVLFWLLATHPRPYRAAGLVALGMAPGLIAATLINEAKFGVLSPLTYGGVGGRVSIGYYAAVLPFVAAGAAGVLLLGLSPVRRVLLRPAVLALAGATAVAACLVAPPLQSVAVKTVLGAWGLVVDFQAHVFAAKGLSIDEHGRLIAFGHVKRALLQSMPYLTVALAALPLLFHACLRRQTLLLIFITGLTIAPFAYGAWFGGMGSSMRYFLHCVPALTILAALGLGQLGGRVTQGLLVALAIGAAGAVGVHVTNNLGGRAPWWSISTPDVLIVVSALLVTAAALLQARAPGWLRLSARQSVYAGVALTITVIWGADLRAAHQVRDLHARFAANAAQVLPPNALLATFRLQYYDIRVNDPDARTSWIKFADPDVSDDLVALTKTSFNEGRPVFVQGVAAAQTLVDRGAAGTATPLFGVNEYSDLYRMTAPD